MPQPATIWVHTIKVEYGSADPPSNAIMPFDGNSPDINAGFGGKHTYLVASHTRKREDAAHGWKVLIQDEHDAGREDLALGTGGKYRYLSGDVPLNPTHPGDQRVVKVGLVRRGFKVDIFQVQRMGYDGFSNDVNEGRGGDFLHVMWKFERT